MGERIKFGEPTVVESTVSPHQLVFEDDGETGYLYVLDLRRAEPQQPIIDALHIYNVGEARDSEHELELLWNADGVAAVLVLDDVVQALVDFEEPRFMCRTGFPPPASDSPVDTHEWDQDALDGRL